MTLQELQKFHPSVTLVTWHQHKNGEGWIENTAYVAEETYVGGDARVSGNVWGFSPLHVAQLTTSSYTTITIGCLTQSLDWFLSEEGQQVGKDNGYDVEEYRLYLNLAKDWLILKGLR